MSHSCVTIPFADVDPGLVVCELTPMHGMDPQLELFAICVGSTQSDVDSVLIFGTSNKRDLFLFLCEDVNKELLIEIS